MRIDVFVNGAAGSVTLEADGSAGQLERDIVDGFAAAGATATVHVVDPSELEDEMLRAWAADPRPDALVVAGGDGTVNGAAAVAVAHDLVLGVLPLGTFNHFAKDLGIPTDVADACRTLAEGNEGRVDVAEVNGRTFVNNSVLGAYPDMVAIRDRIRERHGWGKVRAVPVAALRVLRAYPTHRLDLTGPGFVRRRVRTPMVFVGNGVFVSEGSGPVVRESITDGVLGVTVMRTVSRWGMVRTAVAALVRGTESARDLDTAELPEVVIRPHRRRLRVALDGEVCWLESPLRYRVRPAALRTIVPADAPNQPSA